jgi:hypothetical protein
MNSEPWTYCGVNGWSERVPTDGAQVANRPPSLVSEKNESAKKILGKLIIHNFSEKFSFCIRGLAEIMNE